VIIMIGRIKKFFREVVVEMKKVTWPSYHEVLGSTIVVIITSLFFAVIVGVFDLFLEKVLFFIVGR